MLVCRVVQAKIFILGDDHQIKSIDIWVKYNPIWERRKIRLKHILKQKKIIFLGVDPPIPLIRTSCSTIYHLGRTIHYKWQCKTSTSWVGGIGWVWKTVLKLYAETCVLFPGIENNTWRYHRSVKNNNVSLTFAIVTWGIDNQWPQIPNRNT